LRSPTCLDKDLTNPLHRGADVKIDIYGHWERAEVSPWNNRGDATRIGCDRGLDGSPA
jgi:hypothetical protein